MPAFAVFDYCLPSSFSSLFSPCREDEKSASILNGLGECIPHEGGDGAGGSEEEDGGPPKKKKRGPNVKKGAAKGGAKGKGKAKAKAKR